VFSKICQRIIDVTDPQVLTIIQATECLGFGSHTPKLIGFSPVRQLLSFA